MNKTDGQLKGVALAVRSDGNGFACVPAETPGPLQLVSTGFKQQMKAVLALVMRRLAVKRMRRHQQDGRRST
jgi:hypothetical protein